MDRVLKATVIPELRARGFQGSLPHFRRRRPDRIDLLTFQFDRSGGRFVVELAQCGPEPRWRPQLEDDCRKAAAEVLKDYDRQAEAWWDQQQTVSRKS